MLTVAAPLSGADAERAAHRLFTLWDSGVAVLGGVAAFRPYDDPGTGRRQSDVVLLVPDGVIVARLVGSQRQSGPIVTHPTGAWSIGGEVLRIVGGGSNPLPGLRGAQEAVAATLRASGLEPGRVAMLVGVGSGEPVEPGDGQLADGVIVCPLSEEGLAIGVRRAAALTAAADVRQWTTADVKAALTSLGVDGRFPAVEELNAEGFMYSPYVLRRPDLVAAAGAVASASPADSDLVLLDAGPPTQGMFVEREPQAGLDGMLGGTDREDLAPSPPPQTPGPPSALPAFRLVDDDDQGDPSDGYPESAYAAEHPGERFQGRDGGGKHRVLRVVAVLAVLVLIGVASYVGFRLLGPGSGQDPQAGGGSSGETSAATAPSLQQVGEHSYQLVLSEQGESCSANAYGQVADYFLSTECSSLDRELYTTEIDGVAVIVSVARVTMPDEASAGELKTLADSDGTGNVSDLLRSGQRIPNGPEELVADAYASELEGAVLIIVEVAWLDPSATGDAQAIEQIASEAITLEPAA